MKKKQPSLKPTYLVSTVYNDVFEIPSSSAQDAIRVVQRDFHIRHKDITGVILKT